MIDTPTSLPECLRDHANKQPDSLALSVGEASLNYSELHASACKVANFLLSRGMQKGDRVAILSENSAAYVVVWLGALLAGGSAVPLPTLISETSLAAMVADSNAAFLFVSQDKDGLARMLRESHPAVIGLDFSTASISGFDEVMRCSTDDPQVPITPSDEFNIIYSSGTTGAPKGIVHNHAFRTAAFARRAQHGFMQPGRTLVTTALYSNWSIGAMINTITSGGAILLMTRFTVAECLAMCERERATVIYLVPAQIARILQSDTLQHFDLSAGTIKWCAGAPLPVEHKRQLLAAWPGKLVEIYGQTEGAPGTLLDSDIHGHKLDSVGCSAIPGDIKIIDDFASELPIGAVGEITGRARTIMTGYNNRPEDTSAAQWRDENGDLYLRSGDMGRLDSDGFLYVTGRKKEMIISGGFNVYPADIEPILLQHSMIAEAAAFGVPSQAWGESPIAAIVLRDGATVEPAELLEWANTQLGKVQRLSGLLILKELPRGTIDKVLRRELRDRFVAGAYSTSLVRPRNTGAS